MNDEQAVRMLLAAAGCAPPDDDVRALVMMYPMVRAMADLLFTVGDANDLPAQRFEVEPDRTPG